MMDMLISVIVVITSQFTIISHNALHIKTSCLHLKYTQFSFVNHKVGKKEDSNT